MSRPRGQLAAREREVQELRAHLDRAEQYLGDFEAAIRSEYKKHVPEVKEGVVPLGDTPHGSIATCAECGFHYWPCPIWHLLRRLYSRYEQDEYEPLCLVKKEAKA